MKPTIPFLMALALVSAQSPAPQPDTVIRINVNLVQVDAVVTDSKDKPVTGLKKEDFEILQDGKPQTITNFTFINAMPAGVDPTSPAPRAAAPARGSVPAPAPPAMTTKPASAHRTMALGADDLGLSFQSIAPIRSTLKT